MVWLGMAIALTKKAKRSKKNSNHYYVITFSGFVLKVETCQAFFGRSVHSIFRLHNKFSFRLLSLIICIPTLLVFF